MKHRYRIDPDHGLAVVRFGPEVVGEEIVHLLDAIFRDPLWRPGYSRLWDGRDVRHLDVQPHETEAHTTYLDSVRSVAGPGKSAIVAFRDIDRLTAHLYRERVKRLLGVDIQVFTEMEKAARFLSVPLEACSV